MKLEVFERIITQIQHQRDRSFAANKLGIDLISYEEDYSEIIHLLLSAYYGEEGRDWIDWYLYERDSLSGEVNQAWDKDGNPICYDIPSLWKQVEEIRVSESFKEYELPKRHTQEPIDFEKIVGKLFKF
jgi:hypothetical protein